MTAKLIWRNARRSVQDYLIYIVTMTLCVMLFYAFLSITSRYYQPDIGTTYDFTFLSGGVRMAVLLVALLLLFFDLYGQPLYAAPPSERVCGTVAAGDGIKVGRLVVLCRNLVDGRSFCRDGNRSWGDLLSVDHSHFIYRLWTSLPFCLDAVSGYGLVDDWILCALSLCSRANECTDDP